MRRTLRSLVLLLLPFVPTARGHADVIVNPQNPRYLVDQTRGNLLLTGFGPIVFARHDRPFVAEIGALKTNRVHYARVWPLAIRRGDQFQTSPWMVTPSGWDWNPWYWNRLQTALSEASNAATGLVYVEVQLFDTGAKGWGFWGSQPNDGSDGDGAGFELSEEELEQFRARGPGWRELQDAWVDHLLDATAAYDNVCLLYTSPSPRDS